MSSLLFWRKTAPSPTLLPDNVAVSNADPLPVTLAAPGSASTTAATLAGNTKTVAATGVPEALVGATTLVQCVVLSALRTNTGDVFIGFASGDNTQSMPLPIALSAPDGKKIDLSLIYVDVTVNGEGVRYSTID